MLKFENYLQKYLIEDIVFYRNDPEDGVVIDKDKAKLIYYSKRNADDVREYFLDRNGTPIKISKLDYEIARDGLLSYSINHQEESRTNSYLRNKVINFLKKRNTIPTLKSKAYNIEKKLNSNVDMALSKIKDILSMCDTITKNNNDKDVLNFVKEIKNNIEKYKKELLNSLHDFKDSLDAHKNNNSDNIDEIKKSYRELAKKYTNIGNIINNITDDYNKISTIKNKLNGNDSNYKNEFKNYDPSKDEPIDFHKIKVSTVDEAEKIIADKCGIEANLKGMHDANQLTEIVNSVLTIHDYFPEIFDKEGGLFQHLITQDVVIDEYIDKINKDDEKYKKIIGRFINFDNDRISFMLNGAFLCEHNDDKESFVSDNDSYDEKKFKYGFLSIKNILQAFNKSEKYKDKLGNKSLYNENNVNKFLKDNSIYFYDEDFIKFLKQQNEDLFKDKTDDEIKNDIKEITVSDLMRKLKDKDIEDVKNKTDDGSYAYFASTLKTIVLQKIMYDDIDKFIKMYKENINEKHSISGVKNHTAGNILHEMGHAVDYTYGDILNDFNINESQKNITDFKNMRNIYDTKVFNKRNIAISKYADVGGIKEMFAEAFSAYYESPEKCNDVIKEIMDTSCKYINYFRNKIKPSEFFKQKMKDGDNFNPDNYKEQIDNLKKKVVNDLGGGYYVH